MGVAAFSISSRAGANWTIAVNKHIIYTHNPTDSEENKHREQENWNESKKGVLVTEKRYQ